MTDQGPAMRRFAATLADLYRSAGKPAYLKLIDHGQAQMPPVNFDDSTLSDWLNGRSVPASPKKFQVLVEGLLVLTADQHRRQVPPKRPQTAGLTRHNVRRLENLRAEAQRERRASQGEKGRTLGSASGNVAGTADAATTPCGRPLEEIADPFVLEVHRAIDVETQPGADPLPPLPAYVQRSHDADLRSIVQRAANGVSGVAILVGTSSSGKTRACWEALQCLPSGWRLWQPADSQTALDYMHQVTARTVVWLDETHNQYLHTPGRGDGERLARCLLELLRDPSRLPILVMGTVWPESWQTLTTQPPPNEDDPHPRARTLLTGCGLPVAPAFNNDEDRAALKAKATDDLRLANALAEAEDGEITQYLAGVPVLLERYRTAPDGAAALIWAAMDARRLGHRGALPLPFLEAAASGYLTDAQWHRLARCSDWLKQALDFTQADCRGVLGPLTRQIPRPDEPAPTQPHYRLADYLEQHARAERRDIVPPAAFWDAAADHVQAGNDLAALGLAAGKRGRYRHAFALCDRAANAGNTSVWRELASLRTAAGDDAGAKKLWRRAADAGDPDGLARRAARRMKAGKRAEAEALYRRAADAGDISALLNLAELRESDKGFAAAAPLWQQAAEAGNYLARSHLVRAKETLGEHRDAEHLAWRFFDAHDRSALVSLVLMRERAGNRASAQELCQQAVSLAGTDFLLDVALRWEEFDDHERAAPLYLQAVAAGNTTALVLLGSLLEDTAKTADAEMLYRRAIDAGDSDALTFHDLAWLREHAGDLVEAESLYQRAAQLGWPDGWCCLVRLREEAGEHTKAEELAREAPETVIPDLLIYLGQLRAASGKNTEAEKLYRQAIDAGETRALKDLAWLWDQNGDQVSAKRLRKFGLEPDGHTADPWQT